jgi:hypothetical protein
MNERHDPRLLMSPRPRASWLQRALLAVLGAALAVTAFFFLVFALIAGAILALGIGIRFWWVLRRLRQQARASAPLEGEYTVVERADTGQRLER